MSMVKGDKMSAKRIILFSLVLSLTQLSYAGFWDTVQFWKTQKVDTLIITGNYTKSRLLSEIIQNEEKAPILLFSPKGDKAEFFYLPYGKDAHIKKRGRLNEMLEFINPKSALVVGDSSYVGKDIVKALNKTTIPTTHLSSENWVVNAQAASRIFDTDHIVKDYIRLSQKLNNIVGSKNYTVEPPKEEIIAPVAPIQAEEPGEPLATDTEPEAVIPPKDDANAPQIIEQIPQK
jgi:hypothetical protein